MDAELTRLARGAGRLRFALGAGLEALARVGGHHDLGFSSVEAYALERCERRARWVQETRGLARRLASLPALRRAVETGVIGLSMAQVLAKVAQPDDEGAWLAEACTHTVRQMRKVVEGRRGGVAPEGGGEGHDAGSSMEDSDLRTLSVTVDQEDAWLFECARMIVGHVAGPTLGDAVEALLGEGTTSLLEAMGRNAAGTTARASFQLLDDEPEDSRQREWEAELGRWRVEAEERCERSVFPGGTHGAASGMLESCAAAGACVEPGPAFDGDATAIDAELRRIASDLAVRDLEVGRLAEAFWKADGWRRLGYATDAQYARERLGASLSWLKGRRALARRVAALPALDAAIRSGALGYEAACLVASVATPDTSAAWVQRAIERTVKHLREEVSAVQMLARLGAAGAAGAIGTTGTAPDSNTGTGAGRATRTGASTSSFALWPPSEATMKEIAALESDIVSGAVFSDSGIEGQKFAGQEPANQGLADQELADQEAVSQKSAIRESADPTCGQRGERSANQEPSCFGQLSRAVARMLERVGLAGGLLAAVYPSRRDRARGRVTLRLRVGAGMRRYYRWLERLFARHGPPRTSFLRFLCASLVETWKDSLGSDGAFAEVHARDRYRCTSPVCLRRIVTPHHLRFRSAGGDDSMENMTSLCPCCHLEGVHGGWLRAMPPAGRVTWTLGRRGHEHTVVEGRRRRSVPGRTLGGTA